MSPRKLGVKGLIVHSQAREIISNVTKFMRSEAENGICIPLQNYSERVAAAIGVSRNTIKKISIEAEDVARARPSMSFNSPQKERPHRAKVMDAVTIGEVAEIRQIIYDYVIIEKRRPTLKCILQKIRDKKLEFSGSKTTLWKLFKKMGFRWRKTVDSRSVLIESFDIRLKRIQYLNQILQYRKEGRPIIYTDETYIHSSHTESKGWYDETLKGLKKPVSKGQHAGGEMGFINNSLLIFKSGSKTGDYHENFMKWVETQLLPNLPERPVLVVDNASYHNVKIEASITTATKKSDMIRWLTDRDINVNEGLTKVELYSIIKDRRSKEEVKYRLNQLLEAHGHSVLRLPPYHPELNPIEKIWATVKTGWLREMSHLNCQM